MRRKIDDWMLLVTMKMMMTMRRRMQQRLLIATVDTCLVLFWIVPNDFLLVNERSHATEDLEQSPTIVLSLTQPHH